MKIDNYLLINFLIMISAPICLLFCMLQVHDPLFGASMCGAILIYTVRDIIVDILADEYKKSNKQQEREKLG